MALKKKNKSRKKTPPSMTSLGIIGKNPDTTIADKIGGLEPDPSIPTPHKIVSDSPSFASEEPLNTESFLDQTEDAPRPPPLIPRPSRRRSQGPQSFVGPAYSDRAVLYTQCPGCNTVYRIKLEQIRLGRGEALCERCRIVFSVLSSLGESVRDAGVAGILPGYPPVLGRDEAVASSRYERDIADRAEDGPFNLKGSPLEVGKNLPDWNELEMNDVPRAPLPVRLAWFAGVLSLLVMLIFQAGLFEGDRVIASANLRPALELACSRLNCSLPEYRAPNRIRVDDRTLQPAPDGIEGYEFSLILSNQAGLPQSYPRIKLVLSELNGKPVASRIFQPQEYLNDRQPGLMPVDRPVDVRLLLAKPSREIGGFSFEMI